MSNLINTHTHPLALTLGLLAHTIQELGVLLTCLFKFFGVHCGIINMCSTNALFLDAQLGCPHNEYQR